MKLFVGGPAILFSVLALAAAAGPANAAHSLRADTVVTCGGNHPLANTGVWYGDMSVRNMSCRRGRRLLAKGSLTRRGRIRIPRYDCKLIGYYGDGGNYRCTRGRYALRFSAGG